MAKVNVSLPQGTRDFGADVVRKRNYIFNTIKSVFELYGFEHYSKTEEHRKKIGLGNKGRKHSEETKNK